MLALPEATTIYVISYGPSALPEPEMRLLFSCAVFPAAVISTGSSLSSVSPLCGHALVYQHIPY